jgi:predicted CoA-substrate-specific enzyme activase
MIVAGCDIGSLTAKAVIMDGGKVIGWHVMRVKPEPEESAHEVMDFALRNAGIKMQDIGMCVGTGYGRNHIPFADDVESEIACHGTGAWWMRKTVRTVIDIGGQDAKAIRMDGKGNVSRYAYNDKCATGTGRFLEIMAAALEVGLDEMGPLSLASSASVTLSNQCVVFAETEIVSLVNEGRPKNEIISGLHRAMAARVASLAKGIGIEDEVAFTGGVAKNPGMQRALADVLGMRLVPLETDPQLNGALGAAIIASKKSK